MTPKTASPLDFYPYIPRNPACGLNGFKSGNTPTSCQFLACSCKKSGKNTTAKNTVGNTGRNHFRIKIIIESEPTSMKYDPKEFRALPSVINKEQMRIACHISKRTALYLLQSGLIPCETTGKKTRCYSIKKKDVIAYLKNRETNPEKYTAPQNWYAGYGGKLQKPHAIRYLPSSKASKQQMEAYYSEQLANCLDVLDIDAICKFTGYNRRTVGVWCRTGKLKYIMSVPKYMVPKCFLIEWLISDQHNNTIRKSQKHLNAIWDIHERSHVGHWKASNFQV